MAPVPGQHIADMSCHAWPLRANRACISPAKPPFGCAGCSMLAPASPGAGLLQICAESGWNRRLDAGASTAGGQPTKVRGLPGAGRHWRARSVGAGLCHGARGRRRRTRTARWAQGGIGVRRAVGREVEPSTAGDTGYGACCAARALMNPFTPTFPRYGAVIEIICFVTNN